MINACEILQKCIKIRTFQIGSFKFGLLFQNVYPFSGFGILFIVISPFLERNKTLKRCLNKITSWLYIFVFEIYPDKKNS